MSGNKKNNVIEKVCITDIADEGKAIGKLNDVPVIFVRYAVPGDVVDVEIKRKRKRHYEGRVIKFHSYSVMRQEAFCSHFGVCGGCKWQNLKYEEQLKFKQKKVIDTLTRIGKVPLENIHNIIPSADTMYYRNKLEYTFSNKRWLTEDEIKSNKNYPERNALGFHIPRMFDKILDINECYLQKDPSNQIREATKKYALDHNLEFFDLKEQKGFLRNLIIRTSSMGEVMVIFSFYRENKIDIDRLMNHIKVAFPNIISLQYVINAKANDTIDDQEVKLFAGRDHIFEELNGLKFKIGAKSFFQTNTEQGLNLCKIIREFASLTGQEIVYDLYTGTGIIANFIARQAKKVIGIEYMPESIEDAKVNSQINGITNTSFFSGDMKDILDEDFIETHGRPQVVVLDPPRAGVHEDVIGSLLYCNADRIIYVSCNPATQARDIHLLASKYKLTVAQPLDMFPHTDHVENVVLLEKL